MNSITHTRLFANALIAFFAFGFIFPSLRVLLIGHETSSGAFQYFISALPELIVLCIVMLTITNHRKKKKEIRFEYFDWVTLLFIVSNVVLGFVLANNTKLSLYGFRMTYFPMLFYFLIRFYNFQQVDLKRLLHIIFLSIVALVVVGHILYFGAPSLVVSMIKRTGGEVNEYFIVRMTSILWTPVVFGTFATAAFLYFYYNALSNDHWSNYLFMALTWSGAVLSVSRGAIIPLILGFVIFSFLYFRWKVFLKTFLVMAGVLFLLAFYINTPAEFFRWFWCSSVETVSLKKGVTRVDLWIKAFQDFQDRPFGHGLGMAGHTGKRFLSTSSEDGAIFSTDGWFLKLANETGIWGLLSYLVLSISLFVCFIKNVIKQKKPFHVFLLVFFIAFNIQNMVSNVFDFLIFSFLFWLMMGIGVNEYYQTRVEHQS